LLDPVSETPYSFCIGSLSASADVSSSVPKLLFSRKEAAYSLGIGIRSLDHLIARKELATRRLGKKVMVPAKELERFSRADHFNLTLAPSDSIQ
jgi:hypothetical protein